MDNNAGQPRLHGEVVVPMQRVEVTGHSRVSHEVVATCGPAGAVIATSLVYGWFFEYGIGWR